MGDSVILRWWTQLKRKDLMEIMFAVLHDWIVRVYRTFILPYGPESTIFLSVAYRWEDNKIDEVLSCFITKTRLGMPSLAGLWYNNQTFKLSL